jgi:hypothetical protein
MDRFRRASGLLSLPLTVALALWAVTSGWSALILGIVFLRTFPLSAVLCLARYRRTRELTAGMSWAQAVSLLGFFVFGLTAVEDGGESWGRERMPHSRWTRLTGWSPDSANSSESVARLALGVALLAWFVLFILLVLDLRRHLVTDWRQQPGPFPPEPASRRRALRAKNTTHGSGPERKTGGSPARARTPEIPNRSRRHDEPAATG